ncbi:hypothetical protein SCHPADRAFT_1002029 [Schizopora paradoxa]|uniref:DUF6534 domain-containing protein n=1 Tax=Schizopora paradoxa TaxID=27342 RepID=A0A0H2R6I2_9AGAM|nr:hypothetical protein SCHPADRAFT_1002029 [Schizopora paradoxa]
MDDGLSPILAVSLMSPNTTSEFHIIASFAGPNLLGSLVQGFETGIIFGQALRFWSSSQRESAIVKACVVYALIVVTLQTSFSFLQAWNSLVVNFGSFVNGASPRWPTKLQPVMNVLLAAPLEGLLIWRCWLLTGKSTPILIFFVLAYVASFAFPIIQVHEVFAVDFEAIFIVVFNGLANGMKAQTYQLEPILICFLVVPAVLDISLSGILLLFFFRSRSSVRARRFRKTLDEFIIVIWEAALPPTICTIIAIAVYISTNSTTLWFILVLDILGPLYVIALFVTLNGFHDVKLRNKEFDLESSSSFSSANATRSDSEPQDILSTWAREASASVSISGAGSSWFSSRIRVPLGANSTSSSSSGFGGSRMKVEREHLRVAVPQAARVLFGCPSLRDGNNKSPRRLPPDAQERGGRRFDSEIEGGDTASAESVSGEEHLS